MTKKTETKIQPKVYVYTLQLTTQSTPWTSAYGGYSVNLPIRVLVCSEPYQEDRNLACATGTLWLSFTIYQAPNIAGPERVEHIKGSEIEQMTLETYLEQDWLDKCEREEAKKLVTYKCVLWYARSKATPVPTYNDITGAAFLDSPLGDIQRSNLCNLIFGSPSGDFEVMDYCTCGFGTPEGKQSAIEEAKGWLRKHLWDEYNDLPWYKKLFKRIWK